MFGIFDESEEEHHKHQEESKPESESAKKTSEENTHHHEAEAKKESSQESSVFSWNFSKSSMEVNHSDTEKSEEEFYDFSAEENHHNEAESTLKPIILEDLDEFLGIKLPEIKLPAQAPIIGAEKKCLPVDKRILMDRLKTLIVENYIQDIKIFTENIIECNYLTKEDNRIDAILQFNGEQCHIGVTANADNGVPVYSVMNERQLTSFSLTKGNSESCL